jgi:hypothetical protein
VEIRGERERGKKEMEEERKYPVGCLKMDGLFFIKFIEQGQIHCTLLHTKYKLDAMHTGF